MKIIYKFKKNIKEKGLFQTLIKSFVNIIFGKKSFNLIIKERKIFISKNLYRKFQGIVKHGYFKGLKLIRENSWGNGDQLGSMLLGIYEKEVLEEILSIQNKHKVKYFIDLGAADGYFGIGFLYKKFFKHAFLFDISKNARYIIKKNAEINNIAQDITINGKVESSLYEYLTSDQIKNSLILIDIEGMEFDLLSNKFLDEVNNAFLIIELHDHFFSDGEKLLRKLIKNCNNYFETRLIYSGGRDTSSFKELNDFNDHDRWILCSESRASRGHWLILEPRIS